MSNEQNTEASRREGREASELSGLVIQPITGIDVYILMVRYGADYWSPLGAYRTAEEAQKAQTGQYHGVDAWRIVKVSDMPVGVPDGAV